MLLLGFLCVFLLQMMTLAHLEPMAQGQLLSSFEVLHLFVIFPSTIASNASSKHLGGIFTKLHKKHLHTDFNSMHNSWLPWQSKEKYLLVRNYWID